MALGARPATRRRRRTAHHESFEIQAAPGYDGEDVLPGAHVEFLAKAVVTIPVVVQFEDGTQPTKAMLYWKAGRGTEKWDTWYPHDPVVALRPDAYLIYAKAGAAGEFKSETTEPIEVRSESPPHQLVLTLRERRAVLGRVVFPEGEAPVMAQVHLLAAPEAGGGGENGLLASRRSTFAHYRDGYTFRFTDIASGAYVVGASRDGLAVDVTAAVEVHDQTVDVELEFPSLGPGDSTAVHVRGPDNQPVADANVAVRYPDGRSSGSWAAVRREPGTFWVLNNRGSAGEHLVTATSLRYGTKSQPFAPGPEVTLRFGEPGSLEVTLEGYIGSGLEGMLVVDVERQDGERIAVENAVLLGFFQPIDAGLDAAGMQVFSPLDPGGYVATVRYLGGRRIRTDAIASRAVHVDGGPNRLSIPLPELHSLVVRASSLPEGTPLTISAREGTGARISASATVDAGGVAVFERLPGGEYTIFSAIQGSTRRFSVTVPASGVVVLE